MKLKRGIPVGAMAALAAAVGFGALVALPDRAQAQFTGGDQLDVTAHLVGGPFVDQITVGQGAGGVEVQPRDGTNLGGFFVRGESLDVGTDTVTLVIVRGMQGLFQFGSIDAPFVRTIQEISVSGTLSSEAHLVTDNANQTSFASFTLDCNPFLGCNGGTIVLNVTFAPLPPEEADTSIQGLIDFVVAQKFPRRTRVPLVRQLNGAIKELEEGEPRAAIRNMNNFIAVTRRKEAGGTIDPAVADSMVFIAGDIIAAIIEGAGGPPPL